MGSQDPASVTIRAMTAADMATALDWAAAEGWNPGLADADVFRAADPAGCLMAFVGDQPAASITVVACGFDQAFLGLYIAAPAFRGRGIGFALWQAGLAHAGARSIGLDGVVDRQADYAHSGFVLQHRNIRWSGLSSASPPLDPRLARVGRGLLPAVQAYDAAVTGWDRPGFVEAWCLEGDRRAVAIVEDGAIHGYAVMRRCRQGNKIGPLFAEDPADADLLLRSLAASVRGEEIVLDVPEPNQVALTLAENHNLSPVFKTARMVRGMPPACTLGSVYGITTFELG
jgi:GNAT superfamily N-acetyltransferase